MRPTPSALSLACALSLALAWRGAAAVTVHTWVDDQGVTHFADAPPGGDQPSREVQVDDGANAVNAESDYYSIVNQWQRMRSEREAQDAVELERERIDATRPTPAPPAEMAAEDSPALLYPYPYPYPGPQRRHGYFPVPPQDDYTGPPSSRNSFVNTKPPTWPRER